MTVNCHDWSTNYNSNKPQSTFIHFICRWQCTLPISIDHIFGISVFNAHLSAYPCDEYMCVHIVKMHDDFGLVRPIFTLSTRLQFTLCSSVINLSYVLCDYSFVCHFRHRRRNHRCVLCFFSSLLAILLPHLPICMFQIFFSLRILFQNTMVKCVLLHGVKMKVITAIYAFRLYFLLLYLHLHLHLYVIHKHSFSFCCSLFFLYPASYYCAVCIDAISISSIIILGSLYSMM